MDYKNAKQKNGIYYYPNHNFNTISFQLNFLINNDNDKAPIYDLLCDFLLKSNQVYKTDDDIKTKMLELYYLNLYFTASYYGNQKIFSLFSNMIAPSILQEDYSEEAFRFIKDILRKPDFTNQYMLDIVKRNALSDMKLNLIDSSYYADNLYLQTILPDETKKYGRSVDIDYVTNMIQSVTLKDLEREYNHIMDQFLIGFTFGNISNEQFDSFVDNMSLTPIQKEINYRKDIAVTNGDMEIRKSTEQSYIYVTYDIEKLTYPQKEILYQIFNSTFGLCYQILREKYGLVYASSATIMYHYNKLFIYAEIDGDKKEKFLRALDEMMDDLNNLEMLEQLLATAKAEYFADEYTLEEDHVKIFNSIDFYLLKYQDGLDQNEINERIQNLTSEELMQKIKTMKRKNVFMIRSEANE